MSQRTEEARSVERVADDLLLARVCDRSREAFDVLYRRHVRSVYAYSMHFLRDSGDAEEVVQDAFVTAWERASSIRLVDESILPWLLTTARFKSFNMRRRRQRTEVSLDHESGFGGERTVPSSEEQAHARADSALLQGLVDGLSDRDRDLVELCLIERLSYAQAAQVLGTTHGSVRNRLSRLRSSLRSELRQLKGN